MSIVRRQDKPEAEWRRVEYVVYDAPSAAGGIEERLEVARAALVAAAPVAILTLTLTLTLAQPYP